MRKNRSSIEKEEGEEEDEETIICSRTLKGCR